MDNKVNFETWLHNKTTVVAGFLGSALLSFAIWVFSQVYGQSVKHLESIDNKFDMLTKDIIAIKLQDSANTITINMLKNDVLDLKTVNKEVLGRLGSLEKSSVQHEQQLRQLSK
ncbi:hypothetical protein B9T10_03675 [Wohlfahrtiimonas chitiniclastica]|uniref:hypothetical protein n=1 Tax=Wohlfahrtiimonas chitiniclastica TaxID=400946 RepID=UPI000B98F9AC|nr:hypothetical protein [Wohlfahrtiimonas chitiniclastica]OYQ90431.1 hypothetical protein B9T10_03675 [Wohlfahrtiimonas chitiniclastica]